MLRWFPTAANVPPPSFPAPAVQLQPGPQQLLAPQAPDFITPEQITDAWMKDGRIDALLEKKKTFARLFAVGAQGEGRREGRRESAFKVNDFNQ